MRLRLLGATSLQSESGTDVLKDPQPKRLALLAYLAVGVRGEVVRRDTLLAMFWPDATEKDARRSLNQAVHYLRQLVGTDAIVGSAETVGVDATRLTCDVNEFDDAVREGRNEAALTLYRGHMMDGFFVSGAAEFEDWLARERDVRLRRAADAAWGLSEAAGVSPSAARLAERAYALVPDEGGTRRLMLLYDGLGERARAIETYQGFARRLASEYDAKPAPETQRLIAEIRARGSTSDALRAVLSSQRSDPIFTVAGQPELHAAPRGRRWLRGSTIGVGSAIAAAAAVLLIANASGDERDHNVVAVMPFAYHGDASRAYIGEGVASLLASSLNGVSDLRTVDPRSLFGAVGRGDSVAARTIDGARAIAAELGAGSIVIGDVTESDGRLRISATYSLDGESDTRVEAEGESEKLFEVVDDLAGKLLTRRAPSATMGSSAARTTSSLAAWRLFVAGEADYRAGAYETAVQSLRRAVEIDSTFALAQLRLGYAAHWTGASGLSVQATDAAYRERERLAPLDKRRVEAFRYLLRSNVDSAERAYAKLVQDDPTDVDALYNLADLHFHHGPSLGQPLASTWPEWSRVIALDPAFAGALLHAARVAAASRSVARFDSVMQKIERLDLDRERRAEVNVLRAFAFGDAADRKAAVAEFAQTGPAHRDVLEMVPAVTPTLADVDLLFHKIYSSNAFSNREAGLMMQQAQLQLARGRLTDVRFILDSADMLRDPNVPEFRAFLASVPVPSSSPEVRRAMAARLVPTGPMVHSRGVPYRHYLLGTLAIRDGDVRTALDRAAALDTLRHARAEERERGKWLSRVLRAEVLRAERKPAEALTMLGPAINDPPRGTGVWAYPFAHERFLRAELLAETNQVDDALRWFESFRGPKVYDYMFLNGALLRSAELLERTGQRDRAAQKYEELLAMWSGAQGMESYVRDVRARLARIR